MPDYLDIRTGRHADRVELVGDAVPIGSSPDNGVVLESDPLVSRIHAVMSRLSSGWCIRDLSSTNGTFVNGQRIWAEVPLQPGDEILVGGTVLVFKPAPSATRPRQTAAGKHAPELTRREREVLIELCRPAFTAGTFREPASIREIARALVVTESAVKQHLLRLYDKFEITDRDEHPRVRLANEAIGRGAISVRELLG